MRLSLQPAFRLDSAAAWAPRLAAPVLFVALCALVTWWVLKISAMNTLPVPQRARVAQTEAVETGAVATLFGGRPQATVTNVQLLGVVADIGGGRGAAVVTVDNGPPKALRAGAQLGPQLKLVEIRDRAIVIERNGASQVIPLPAQPQPTRGPAPAARPQVLPPSGAAAPLSTPAAPGAPAPVTRSAPPAQSVQSADTNPGAPAGATFDEAQAGG
ncbi:type II secretion system protein N [Cupriavidus sp. AU9028]|uniref:type II secretion system protein N n=1 Tax=Cupriavidus sp. AU9028 TaxID=2871157 RepID=UPI001C96D9E4|nr:general secretion pathway protein [Cupriavidus sp. AU9028]